MPTTHHTEHRTTVAAPAEVVFGLVEDVTAWPATFPPCVHVEHLERGDRHERIQIWATANGAVKGWTSRRELDRDRLRISFRQEVSQHPVAAMGGEWIIEPRDDGTTLVRLTHDFQAVGDERENVDWITTAVDTNSDKELAALRSAAEHGDDLAMTFADVVHVNGAAKDVYEFLYRADEWPRRLPHVARVVLGEETPNVQTLEMDTRTTDGSLHTTESVRICVPSERIAYKQLRTPALMSAHTGQWLVREVDGGTEVTSVHTVVINPEPVARILGEGAGVPEARTFVRNALGHNSTTTMQHAKTYAETI